MASKKISQTRTPVIPEGGPKPATRSGAPLPGADPGQPLDGRGDVIPPEQRKNLELLADRGPGTDQPPTDAPSAGKRGDLQRPDANEKQVERNRLAAKARENRETLAARAQADHPQVFADEQQTMEEMAGTRLMPGDAGYEMPPEPGAEPPASPDAPPQSTAARLAAQPPAAPAAAPAVTPTPGAPAAPAPQPVDNGENYYTVKVYGVERRVLKAVVDAAGGITTYQKNLAAEVRMQNAATLERENEAERQRLAKEREDLDRQRNNPAGTKPLPPTPGAGADRKARSLQITRTLFSGNEEQTAAAIEEILGTAGNSNPQMTPEQIAEKAVQMLEQRQTERDSAGAATAREAARVNVNTLFKTAYPELAADKAKTLYTQQLTREKLDDPANRGRDLEEIAVEAAEQALVNFGIRRAAGGATDAHAELAPELQRRETAKRLGPFDPAPSVRSPAPAEAPAPKTRSDIVAGIRKARGQPDL